MKLEILDFEKMGLEEVEKQLREEGLDEKAIGTFINTFKRVQIERVAEESSHLSVKEVVYILKTRLPNVLWNENKVRRFIRSGAIKTVNKVDRKAKEGASVKEGYRIHKTELERFIEEEQMTKAQWKEEALALREKVKQLELQIQLQQDLQEDVKEETQENAQQDDVLPGQLNFYEVEDEQEDEQEEVKEEEQPEVKEIVKENVKKNKRQSKAKKPYITYAKILSEKNVDERHWEVSFKYNKQACTGLVEQEEGILNELITVVYTQTQEEIEDKELLFAIQKELFKKLK